MKPAPGTRLRRVTISFEILRDLFMAGAHPARRYSVIRDAIPPDAILVNVQHEWPNCVEMLLWSESFAEVKLGDLIPPLDIFILTEVPDRTPTPALRWSLENLL